jgi:ubiquinone/menaquinone biosynthesis C-methylase UbiE
MEKDGLSEPSAEALEKNLTQFYDSLAPIYDLKYRNPSIDYMRKVEWSVIERHVGVPRMRFLDLGCGTGSLAVKLAAKGNEVVGVDISTDMIAIARRKAMDAGVQSRLQFLVASIEDLPSMPSKFDFACSTFGAFNHVKSLSGALRGLNHILSSRGWLFFSLANKLSIHETRTESHEEMTDWKRLEMNEIRKAVWTRFYTRNEVETAVRESGFRIVNVGGMFYLVRPSYAHSDSKGFGVRQSVLAKTESLLRWHNPANRRAAYLIFLARKASVSD